MTSASCTPGVAVATGEAQRLERYTQSLMQQTAVCTQSPARLKGIELLGIAQRERCVQAGMSSGCARPAAAWAPGPDSGFAELPVGMAVWPAADAWHLDSTPVSSDMLTSFCVL